MEKGRKLFNRIRKPKRISKDIESVYSDDSFYSSIKEEPVVKENLYPIDELNEMKKGIDEQVLADILDKSKIQRIHKNTEAYLASNNQVCHYIFDKKNKKNYNKVESNYRNDVIFNPKHERFTSIYDPWLFVSHEGIEWPDYVTKLYYTKLTPTGDLVRLSYSTNLYLNKLFKTQSFAPVLRIFHYPIYELASKLLRQPTLEDIKREFITEEFIMDYGNVEIIERSGNIKRDFNIEDKTLTIYDINAEQPTEIAYNSFFDYIPICFNPPQKNEHGEIYFEDPKNLIMSDICFHKDDCHDNWCETHNCNNISFLNKHEHYHHQTQFKPESQQILNFCQYINNNA
jgi:hypothetical protein